jgi:hypothetical protein
MSHHMDSLFEGATDYPLSLHDDTEAIVGFDAARKARLFVAANAPRGQVLEVLRMLGLAPQAARTRPVRRDEFGNVRSQKRKQ